MKTYPTLTLQTVLTLSPDDLAAIGHAVASDPEQSDSVSPAEAWARRVHRTLGVNAHAAIIAKADKYRAEYLEESSAEGENYLDAADKADLAERAARAEPDAADPDKADAAADAAAAQKLADYLERRAIRQREGLGEASGDVGDARLTVKALRA